MLRYWIILLIVLAGLSLAVQAAANARMSMAVQAPVMGALVNFAVGGAALAAVMLSGAFGRGNGSGLLTAPWWAWIGGLFGALYITIAIITVPRVGTALTFGALIFGQLAGALILDTFGWLGVPRIELNPWRVAGVAVLFVGVLMMQHK